MLNLRTRKILRDIVENKARTFLVVLTIAIGVFSIGSLARVWVLLGGNISEEYQGANPASATITTATNFDEALVTRVSRMEEVAAVEGVNSAYVRVQVGENQFRTLLLIARADYNALTINTLEPEAGAYPPADGQIVLERTSLDLLPFAIDETVTLEAGQGRTADLEIVGTVHDVVRTSSSFTLVNYGYVTPETFQEVTGRRDFTQLYITVAQDPFNEAHIERVVDEVTGVVEANNEVVTRKDVPTPGQHELNNIIQSVLFLLATISGFGLLLGVFLVGNIISAQLTQQTQQIGTIKAVGGVSRQIMVMYIRAVILFGALALVVTLPLIIAFATGASIFFADLINFNITRFAVPLPNYLLEILVAFIVPCLAAAYPILKASRLTVRESIGFNAGQNTQFGGGFLERLSARLPAIPATILYPFRNIFRRKVRLMLAAFTLSIAGAIWIAVGSVRASFETTVDSIAQYWDEDLNIATRGGVSFGRIERIMAGIDGVAYVEPRFTTSGFRLREDGSESIDLVDLFGVVPDSPFLEPQLVEGRWLQPDDTTALVVNLDLFDVESDIGVGDEVIFTIGEQRTTWEVVGLATSQVIGGTDLLNSPIAYVNYTHLTRILREPGQANRVLVSAPLTDIEAVSDEIETQFGERSIGIASLLLKSDVRDALDESFRIILSVLQITSVVYGLIGGLGLTSMMTLNVLERTREVGIIRSVGGVRAQLAQIIVIEGVFVGVMSWFVAVIVAYPLSIVLGNAVGSTLLSTPLTHVFPAVGPLVWLGLVFALSVISSLLPGRNAARMSVRETISFG